MPPEAEVDDLRGDIEAALGNSEGSAQASPDPVIPEANPPQRDNEPAQAAEGEGSGKPAAGRDSLGRFLPKTGQEAPGAPATPPSTQPLAQPPAGQPGAAQAPAAPASVAPPPAGWSVTAKEAWTQAPAAVQQEVQRREAEMARFVNDTAPARQMGEKFWQACQPHLLTMQAEGVDPITAAANLMQFATRMRMGTPGEKAQTMAMMCNTYGVDLQALDSALAGQPLPQQAQQVDPNYVQNAVQQALQPLFQAAQQRQQGIAQAADTHARTEMQAFAAQPEHKYFEELRGTMADMVEMAQRQGIEMSLEDAYQRAALLHPEISKVIIAQRQGANAQQLTAAAQRAKAAAVSVNGSAPIGNPNVSEPSSIRESIEAAIEAHSRY